MGKTQKDILKRIIVFIIALFLLALFSSFLLRAAIGGDAIIVFEQGLSNAIGLSIGWTIAIINVVLTIVLFFVDKSKINIGTLLMIALLGVFIDLILAINIDINPNDKIFISIIIVFFALIGLALAISLYINADIGLAPFEAFLVIIQERTQWRFAYIKMANDAILFLIGWLLGGIVGIGSVMAVIMLGPLIDMFTYLSKKIKFLPQRKIDTH